MAKRYYLCDIIHDELEGYIAAVHPLGVPYTAVFPPQDPQTGEFSVLKCLVLVDTDNHAKVIARAGCRPLPDFPLDGKVNAMRTDTIARLSADVQDAGLNVTWGNSDGYREAIRSIGSQLLGVPFNEETMR